MTIGVITYIMGTTTHSDTYYRIKLYKVKTRATKPDKCATCFAGNDYFLCSRLPDCSGFVYNRHKMYHVTWWDLSGEKHAQTMPFDSVNMIKKWADENFYKLLDMKFVRYE